MANYAIILASVTIKFMKQKHLVLVAAVIVIAIAGYFYINRDNEGATTDDANENINVPATEGMENNIPTNENSNTAGNVPSTGTIIVSDQTNNSTTVTIDNLNTSKPGFVAISIKGPSGETNQIIGTSGYLTAGAKQDLEIKLRAGSLIDSSIDYVALVYEDDGDKKFDPQKDKIVTRSSPFTGK